MISKEKFLSVIGEIKKWHDLEDDLWKLGKKYNQDADWYIPSTLEDALVDLLEICMGDSISDISYFIYELDFGKEYEPGDVLGEDGKEIDFSSAASLYDYLLSSYNDGWNRTEDIKPLIVRKPDRYESQSNPIIFQTLDKIQHIGFYLEIGSLGFFRANGKIWEKDEVPAWRPCPQPYKE